MVADLRQDGSEKVRGRAVQGGRATAVADDDERQRRRAGGGGPPVARANGDGACGTKLRTSRKCAGHVPGAALCWRRICAVKLVVAEATRVTALDWQHEVEKVPARRRTVQPAALWRLGRWEAGGGRTARQSQSSAAFAARVAPALGSLRARAPPATRDNAGAMRGGVAGAQRRSTLARSPGSR